MFNPQMRLEEITEMKFNEKCKETKGETIE